MIAHTLMKTTFEKLMEHDNPEDASIRTTKMMCNSALHPSLVVPLFHRFVQRAARLEPLIMFAITRPLIGVPVLPINALLEFFYGRFVF